MRGSTRLLKILLVALAGLLVQVFTWFVMYPVAGYNDVTLFTAQFLFLLLGIVLIVRFRMPWDQIGLSTRHLLRAMIGIGISYALLLVILVLLNAMGHSTPIFRQQYPLYALINNWLLTGLGEELFFSGILVNMIAGSSKNNRRWSSVLLTAALFSLWHLPGYVAVGLRMNSLGPGLIFDLLLNFVSWGFFGCIYLFSGNLWLTAFAHASTDYGLLPVITSSPILGLVFMLATILIAWKSVRAEENGQIHGRTDPIETASKILY